MSSNILYPLNKVPLAGSATLLIVGSPGVGKHSLSKAIVSLNNPFSLQVRTASSLPLPEEHADSRPRLDLLVFLVDLYNRESMQMVKKSLQVVDVHYFLGRVVFVATHGDGEQERSVPLESITQLADAYNSPLLFANLETEIGHATIGRQLCQQVEIAAGFCHQVSPLHMDATRLPYQTMDL